MHYKYFERLALSLLNRVSFLFSTIKMPSLDFALVCLVFLITFIRDFQGFIQTSLKKNYQNSFA
jgi:hypothetical protein